MAGRLSLALERGIVSLSEGETLVIGALADSDLGGLDKDTTRVLWRYADVRHALANAGWNTVSESGGSTQNVIVFAPRARAAQRAYIRLAREMASGPIIIDGLKTDGIDALYKELKKRAEVSEAWSKAHGKVFTVSGGDFSDWPSHRPAQDSDGWWRAPGVFSADGIDPASAILAESLPASLPGTVVDLGAGWGFLSRAILEREDVAQLSLVENDETALDAAKRNIKDDRATFHCADARDWTPTTQVDHVVTNPPFHTGRAAEPSLGQDFIRAAGRILQRQGTLWLVANRHLPYETVLEETFRDVHLLKETAQFKLYRANQPRARRKG